MNEMNKENQKYVEIEVDGEPVVRAIDYSVNRGGKVVHYPKLEEFEHFFETDDKLVIFRSVV